ncbi:MAG: hypothetical protein DBX05_06815 [Candidatus Poseidoniales archaeon]|nr:MAG: hypothetical protein DBX05_06815 [Candidatus Poseidoniales archaeon]CAI8213235.1 MAG: Uncharacterised protein [Euryarchaeota archaeon]|tara:strand:- start:3891 stop:4814 length:924 start_codon:yes stop_codon:yes gene_type:complete
MTASNDTAHLYDGKTVRSGAPSRQKAAGRVTSSTEIPKDAIPEVHIPSFVESLFGGPLVPKMKFLPAAKNVQNLQFASGGAMVVLAVLTYIVTPQAGTPWFALGNVLGVPAIGTAFHVIIILGSIGTGFWGVFQRDSRFLITSYVLFILISLRFAASAVTFGTDLSLLPESEGGQKSLLVLYAVFLVMYIELSNGVIRFSMLDTSIRTGEVYVMNEKKVLSRYQASLILTPLIAGTVAFMTLFVNVIIPLFIGIIDKTSAARMEESLELTSVYGVALGTMIVFLIVAGMFAVNLPLRIQQFRENTDD